MNHILIFSGTSEGRALSEGLAARGIPHTVFVATEYGELMMHDDPLVEVRQGRLDEAEMEALFRSAGAEDRSAAGAEVPGGLKVYDATHPFAVEVTENIRSACEKAGAEYIRILRDRTGEAGQAGQGAQASQRAQADAAVPEGAVRYFSSAAECAEALAEVPGNILLTTGSKELSVFAGVPGLVDRLYARVLPSADSIRLCTEAGLEGRHVIAMHGPFSKDLNKAIIDQYSIDILVTKETGSAGGYPEKLAAAAECGIKAFVIGRPKDVEGISVEEALSSFDRKAGRAVSQKTDESDSAVSGLKKPERAMTGGSGAEFNWSALDLEDEPGRLSISLIGIGPGNPEFLTEASGSRVAEADAVFGAPRMIEGLSGKTAYPYYLAKDVLPLILKEEATRKDLSRGGRYAVLFSGDSGFFSGAKKMKAGLEEGLEKAGVDFDIEILPGISSLSLFAARLGADYSDAALFSMHGKKDPERALAALMAELKEKGKVFTLLSGKDDAVKLAERLRDFGPEGASMFLGKDLSYPEEAVAMVDLRSGRLIPDVDGFSCLAELPAGSYVAYICAPAAVSGPLFPIIGDDEFERGKVPMTKEAVRHLSIARLKLQKDSVLYDVGSGTGSIAVQAASISDTIRVYAIEKKPEALDLIRQNAAKFRLAGVIPVEGTAPEALMDLEKPTHAFIGGSGGNLKEILETIRGKNPEARVVINAVSLETMAEMTSVVKEFPIKDLSIEQIQASRSRTLGNYHLMTADNPVMICAFEFAREDESSTEK